MYTCYNNEFYPVEKAILKVNNRSFLYGDGLFESIRLINGKIFLLQEHLQRLDAGMKILHMNKPDYFTIEYFSNKIDELSRKNNLKGNARIRLNIFRNDGGLYTPDNDKINYLITATSIEEKGYKLNTGGLNIDLFNEMKKPVNILSSIKTCNSLLFVLAGIWKSRQNLEDCLILNEENRICEGLSSNVFLVKENHFITPAITEGCIKGVMRGKIIELIKSMSYTVHERVIEASELMIADEVFLTNVSSGLRWVSAYRNKRYFSKVTKQIMQKLNDHVNEN
jgi:branched-chain amino acid aminotransferase